MPKVISVLQLLRYKIRNKNQFYQTMSFNLEVWDRLKFKIYFK